MKPLAHITLLFPFLSCLHKAFTWHSIALVASETNEGTLDKNIGNNCCPVSWRRHHTAYCPSWNNRYKKIGWCLGFCLRFTNLRCITMLKETWTWVFSFQHFFCLFKKIAQEKHKYYAFIAIQWHTIANRCWVTPSALIGARCRCISIQRVSNNTCIAKVE